MKVRTIISIAVAAIGLTSTALSDKYDDLVTKGYRWVTIDGPFACASKDDVDRIIKNQSDENMVRMLEQGRLYFLIRGTIVSGGAGRQSFGYVADSSRRNRRESLDAH